MPSHNWANAMPNVEAQNDFWWFVNERQRIYLKKEKGDPKPWSIDPIFQKWKFCNVFRDQDTQSKWLIDNVLVPHADDDPALLLFNIFAFRAFNWYPTYQTIGDWQTSWDVDDITDLLEYLVVKKKKQLTSGAYMIRGYLGKPKWQSIPETLEKIWLVNVLLSSCILEKPTLYNAWDQIVSCGFWGWGPFTSYQVALDLTYTPLLEAAPDLNTWAYFGPGAIKGLREIWPTLPARQDWMLAAAKTLLADQVKYREKHVPELNLNDIEFVLCELGKYRKIKRGGRGSTKYAGS